jgi:hypothetical protein
LKEAKGEHVRLKIAVIKAIDLMIRAISSLDNRTVEILNSAKLALESTPNDILPPIDQNVTTNYFLICIRKDHHDHASDIIRK